MDEELAPFLKSYASWPKYFKKWHTEVFVPLITMRGHKVLGGGSTQPSIILVADDATVSVVQSSSVEIALTLTRSGYTGTVTLAVAGLPTGVTGAFSDSSLASGETNSTLTLTAASDAPTVSADAFTITASGSGVSDATVSGPTVTVVASGVPTPFFANDWSGYANSAAMRAAFAVSPYDAVSMTFAEIDTSVTLNGLNTLRYDITGAGAGTGPGVPILFVYLTSDIYNFWYNFKIRWAPGFTTTGLIGGSNAYKVVSWGWGGAVAYDGRGTIEISNTDQYQLNYNPVPRDFPPSTNWVEGWGTIVDEWTDGLWYNYVVNIRMSGQYGRSRAWMAKDGDALVLVKDSLEIHNENGLDAPPVGRFSVGLNFNQNFTLDEVRSLWWGPVRVWDGAATPDPLGLGEV